MSASKPRVSRPRVIAAISRSLATLSQRLRDGLFSKPEAKREIHPLAIAHNMQTMPYFSLGMVTSLLREWNDGALQDVYAINRVELGGVEGLPVRPLVVKISTQKNPICLFSSYVWNYKLNMLTARQIKSMNPSATIIMGGPEVPKYLDETEAFLAENTCIDVAVLGEGELACAEALEAYAGKESELTEKLRQVKGIVFSRNGKIERTPNRARVTDVNTLPSPYLKGEFEPWFEGFSVAILETNRGCPYGCTYCDWGSATLEKVTKFSPARVKDEIDYISRHKTEGVFIADANFGMLEQDIEIAQALVEARAKYGFPLRLAVNFAKNGGRRLMAVIKILHNGGLLPTGIIALQTTDEDTLKAIKRDNIKTSSYEKMMDYFNQENIPMASDIMIGLPGQTIDSLQYDLQFCFNWKVSANGNYTSMMPNAPMAEKSYRQEFAIKTDERDMIISTSSFGVDDLVYMKALYLTYQFHVRLGILKYYLYYVQIEHGIPAMDILRHWLDAVIAQDQELPISVRVYNEVIVMEKQTGDWPVVNWDNEADFFFEDLAAYCAEIYYLTQRDFGINIDSSVLDTLCAVQQAVSPRLDRDYPYSVELTHDIDNYFAQIKTVSSVHEINGKFIPLNQFPPSELRVVADTKRHETLQFAGSDTHADAWELPSPLRFY